MVLSSAIVIDDIKKDSNNIYEQRSVNIKSVNII